MQNSGIFITGTDTDVGKTLVSAAIIRLLVRKGYSVAGMKPVASGCDISEKGLRNQDAVTLQQESNILLNYDQVNPYAFEPAIAPHIAAQESERSISIESICETYIEISRKSDFIIVEGVGGWQVPINNRQTMADLAIALKLPVVLVTGLRLGCINHTLLTAEAIQNSGASLFACVASEIDQEYLRCEETLQTLTNYLHLGVQKIPWFNTEHTEGSDIIEHTTNFLIPITKQIHEKF